MERDTKSLMELIAKARAVYDAMTPEQRAEHDTLQRESWVRGEMGMVQSSAPRSTLATEGLTEWELKEAERTAHNDFLKKACRAARSWVEQQGKCICWMDVQSKDCPVHGYSRSAPTPAPYSGDPAHPPSYQPMRARPATPTASLVERLMKSHDYNFEKAKAVSNLKKPYTDNNYGRVAALQKEAATALETAEREIEHNYRVTAEINEAYWEREREAVKLCEQITELRSALVMAIDDVPGWVTTARAALASKE